MSSSIAGCGPSRVGRARELSNSVGESCCPGSGGTYLVRFAGDEVVGVEKEHGRFFETRLAAERICFASLSSGKKD